MRAVILIKANGLNERVQGDIGAPLTLDDDEAAYLVGHKFAVYDPVRQAALDGAPSPQTTFVGPDEAARRMQAMQDLVDLTEEMGLYDEPAPTAEELREARRAVQQDKAGPELKRPYGNASKAAWIDWAVHQGADAVEAAQLTKNQLMARYGERL